MEAARFLTVVSVCDLAESIDSSVRNGLRVALE